MRRFREAFVICPISKPETPVRQRSDRLMEAVIEPVLTGRYSCVVGRADFYFDDPDFTEVIHQRIARADIIVADLTGLNANVLYELGQCHLLGLPCVLFIDTIDKLPSDLRLQKAIEYSLGDLGPDHLLSGIIARFQGQVGGLKGFVPRPMPREARAKLIDRFRLTTVEEVHTGRRDHYRMARAMIGRRPTRALLMQRSSTLILGPEAEWGDEAGFYEAIWTAVDEGMTLYHIVSKEGIRRHLDRPQSKFPQAQEAQQRLHDLGGNVALPGNTGNGSLMQVKVIPEEASDVDLKPDRQARVLVAEFPEAYEAILVMDLGGKQVSLRLIGPDADGLFHSCMDFYSGCWPLAWQEVRALMAEDHEIAS